MAKRDIYTCLVYARQKPVIGKLAYFLLKCLGVEIPLSVKIGNNFTLEHGGFGTVVHSKCIIGNNVRIYPGVTIGRSDIHLPSDQSAFEGILIEDDVIIASGAKVLCNKGILNVSRGSMIGANAVLLQSTAENEIWAGVPARQVGFRKII